MGCNFLKAAGLLGEDSSDVARLLGLWEGSLAQFSNGVVVELVKQFFCPEVVTAVSKLVGRLLGMNLQRLTSAVVHNRLRWYLMVTEKTVKNEGGTLSEPWLYLRRLQPGGKLY